LERAIEIERFGPVEHQDWEDEVPADASALSCEIEYRTTQDDPAPVATEVCGTPYTVDEGSGFGEVVQDCTYRVYEQMCTYTVDEWAVIDTRRASGADLNPQWPAVSLAANGERAGAEHESFTVTLQSDGDALLYTPSTEAEFAIFLIGSGWTVTVNGLGAIVGVAPALAACVQPTSGSRSGRGGLPRRPAVLCRLASGSAAWVRRREVDYRLYELWRIASVARLAFVSAGDRRAAWPAASCVRIRNGQRWRLSRRYGYRLGRRVGAEPESSSPSTVRRSTPKPAYPTAALFNRAGIRRNTGTWLAGPDSSGRQRRGA
jgi:hypothetical protein